MESLGEMGVAPPSDVAPVRQPWRLDGTEWAVVVLTLASAALRLAFVTKVHPPVEFDYSDMHAYFSSALHFADPKRPTDLGDWYMPSGTATFIALWIAMLGATAGPIAAAVVQGLLSAVEVPLVYLIGRRFFDRRVGLAAATLLATHYLAVSYAGFFMSENYLTFGLVGALALLRPERAGRCLGAGLLLGVGAWAKSQAFLLAPLWALLLVARGRRWRPAVAVVAGALAVVVPMSIVASVKNGRPVFLSPNGGQTFALGQCPIQSIVMEDPVTHGVASWGLPNAYQRIGRGEGEAAWGSAHYHVSFSDSGYYLREGLRCIRRFPRHAFKMVWLHLADTFAGPPWSNVVPWPDSATRFGPFALASNLFVAYLVAPLAFLGLWLKRRKEEIWLVFGLPVFSLLASAALFHGDPRFREPYDFAFFLAGAAAVFALLDRWRGRESPTEPAAPAGAS